MFRRRRESPPALRVVPFSTIRDASAETLAAAFAAPPEEAAPWIKAAALAGMARAQVLWGQYLLDGIGNVPRDPAAAVEWFRAAARAGVPEGMNMLGRCHEMGWGTAKDHAEAARLFRQAAEAGFDWGQYNLGNMHYRGQGVPQDYDEALRWYRAAALQGHAKSLNMVARFLEEGWGVARDPQAAVRLYVMSAERGDFRGQFNLGVLLTAQGEIEEAARWFRAAAERSHEEFRRGMVERLAARPEAELQAVAREIRAGRKLASPCASKA